MSSKLQRPHGRNHDAMRPVEITLDVMKFAEGSAQIDLGDTRVVAAASVEDRVPKFKLDSGEGWVTAEYSMLPRATHTRSMREVNRGRAGGRTMEIQRLIGRSLRTAVDFKALGERTVTLDCDVLQADGGTRTASITAAYIALVQALAKAFLAGDLARWPIMQSVAAVSVGYVDGIALLDLEYCEDSVAEIDMNIVATGDGQLIEIQGTGEQRSFPRAELDTLVDLALGGIDQLVEMQDQVLQPTLSEVRALRQRGRHQAPPKDEGDLWGPPG